MTGSRQKRMNPITRRRLAVFRANRRGWWSLWIFLVLFLFTLFAEFVSNDKPFLVSYQGEFYSPIFKAYPETDFGGQFETEADYRDPYLVEKINRDGWMLWPLIRYDHRTVAWDLPVPAPSPPGRHSLAGDRRSGAGRDGQAHLRLPDIHPVRLHPDHPVGGDRRRRRRRAGLFRRQDRPAVPAIHGGLVGHADPLPADHPRQRGGTQLLVAARADAALLLDGFRRRGPRRVPAGA